MKVIVVDDVGVVRHSMDRLLTDNGYSVVTAASGNDAIELLKKDNTIGAVLTDLLMPGMDGIDLFKASLNINRLTDAGEIPPPEFILMTALRPSADVHRKEAGLLQQAVSLGFVDVMLKPIDKERLFRNLSMIQKRLNGESTGGTDSANTSTGSPTAGVEMSGSASAPPASGGGRGGGDWQTAVEEVRTITQSKFEQFQSEHNALKAKLNELQALVEELRSPS
ncbi:MAG: response regulator [Planctomycetaceae bacterium]|jgi:CheY-like chemotaxis protein|nr:response regulator [Planctomycetaceae bacterium]MBT6153489.1 response regulator [Planctomycetaceae bacterium]MBT6484018.1 response regulator [Planctomycetaceae bacterium]MBT6495487.1 response regulator [Planctomycetaceae bacterium]